MLDSLLSGLEPFGEAAKILVEKCSDAIGGIFKPMQTKREAKAEVEAGIIRAVGDIEKADAIKRAVGRFFGEEAKKQLNMEAILGKAIPLLSESTKPQDIEDDWITNFFEKCRLISDEDMQQLWAHVLAGQANSPGKFTKSTVQVLYNLEQSDAELFGNLCSFILTTYDKIVFIYDFMNPIYRSNGVDFPKLNHLQSLGLIHVSSAANYKYFLEGPWAGSQLVEFDYFGNKINLKLRESDPGKLISGKVILSRAGEQLEPFISAKPVPGFIEYLINEWKRIGYKNESN